jgi:hypothetical protein
MSAIVLVDTSVLLNVLDVPGMNADRAKVLADFERLVDEGHHLFMSMAAVFEAGNHIAQLADGRQRRRLAQRFVTAVQAALNDQAPWKPMRFPDPDRVASWLDEFPDAAMRGLGMGDLSMVEEWRALCGQFPLSRVRIWSLDGDLAAHDRVAPGAPHA